MRYIHTFFFSCCFPLLCTMCISVFTEKKTWKRENFSINNKRHIQLAMMMERCEIFFLFICKRVCMCNDDIIIVELFICSWSSTSKLEKKNHNHQKKKQKIQILIYRPLSLSLSRFLFISFHFDSIHFFAVFYLIFFVVLFFFSFCCCCFVHSILDDDLSTLTNNTDELDLLPLSAAGLFFCFCSFFITYLAQKRNSVQTLIVMMMIKWIKIIIIIIIVLFAKMINWKKYKKIESNEFFFLADNEI